MPVLPSSKIISTARILHDVCPKKYFFSRIWGGATALPAPPSPTPMGEQQVRCVVARVGINIVPVELKWQQFHKLQCSLYARKPPILGHHTRTEIAITFGSSGDVGNLLHDFYERR